jgi:hypothetical protein
LHSLSPTNVQRLSVTSVLAESIWEHLVWHQIPLLWVFQIPDANVLLYIRYNIYCAIVSTIIGLMHAASSLKPIFGI